MKTINVLCLIALVICISGCGGSSHESVMKETMSAMNDMADALEKSKTAEEAKPKLEAVSARLKDLKKKMDKLGEPNKAQQEELSKKLGADIVTAAMRLDKAAEDFKQRDPAGFEKLETYLKDAK